MGEYFKNLSKQKLIKKSTFSMLYHPMLNLAKKYTVHEADNSKDISITSDHIFLLCYLMGYVQNKPGSETYFGSNRTLSKDLGTSVRTVQRRLKDLSDVGFIITTIDDCSYRNIYINFEKIMLEISKEVGLEYDFEMIFRFCKGTAACFASDNLLEKSQISTYASYLKMQYLLEISKNPVTEPIRFLFGSLADYLGIDFSLVKEKCEMARTAYIKLANDKQIIS